MPEKTTLPGSDPASDKLLQQYQNRQQTLGKNYRARTRHINKDGSPLFINRLFLESSPYLLQHAHNPVNWFPWGTEAFDLAKELNRPVLLSIGYSTCHWCHVMEEESFEDVEIARFINQHFVAIKMDREERPDIDAIYMSAVQAMTGQGGWPLNVWLTPDKKPFFGGTYFPARDGDRGVQQGFLSILVRLQKIVSEQPEVIEKTSAQLVQHIQQSLEPVANQSTINDKLIASTVEFFTNRLDPEYGGLQGAPKFPSSFPLRLLLRHYVYHDNQQILDGVILTLDKMAGGGMHDHVGGGFHRYSVDARWLVPHFEKMLYDNALLALAYLETYQLTREDRFRKITEKILRYIDRDMTSAEGAFYSATDADSPTPEGHREEGWFFTWTPTEIDSVLTKNEAELIKAHYQIMEGGNFEGRSILHTPEPLDKTLKGFKHSSTEAETIIETSLEKLYQERLRRPGPIRDEKILTAWNALMISAYARAGWVLNADEYLEKAKNAAGFILSHMIEDGRLYRRHMNGKSGINAYLEDYSFLIAALIDLYESTYDIEWIKQAITLDQILEKLFEDKQHGGFFMTSHDHEELIAREKPAYDGAEPSGNSVAILNLLKLYAFTDVDNYRTRAEKAFNAFSSTLNSNPVALTEMLLAIDFYHDQVKQIVIVTAKDKPQTAEPFINALRQTLLPNSVLCVVEDGPDISENSKIIPLLKNKHAIDGKTTAYVCVQNTCKQPAQDVETFTQQITSDSV